MAPRRTATVGLFFLPPSSACPSTKVPPSTPSTPPSREASRSSWLMSSSCFPCPCRYGSATTISTTHPISNPRYVPPVELANSLGVHVERLLVRSPRPVAALLQLTPERRPGLLVLGSDPARLSRRFLRRVWRTVREDASCLVWRDGGLRAVGSRAGRPGRRSVGPGWRGARPGRAGRLPASHSCQPQAASLRSRPLGRRSILP